jgi:hypothetical protein
MNPEYNEIVNDEKINVWFSSMGNICEPTYNPISIALSFSSWNFKKLTNAGGFRPIRGIGLC